MPGGGERELALGHVGKRGAVASGRMVRGGRVELQAAYT